MPNKTITSFGIGNYLLLCHTVLVLNIEAQHDASSEAVCQQQDLCFHFFACAQELYF